MLSKIEKKSFSKDKDSDLSLKKLNLLKFPNKSYNIKTNIIKNYQYNDSNSNSFNYKPNNKKDYNSIYNSNNGFKKNLRRCQREKMSYSLEKSQRKDCQVLAQDKSLCQYIRMSVTG